MGSFAETGYMDTESPLTVVQGTDFGYFWAPRMDDGRPYDTSGHDAQMQVRLTPDSEAALASWSVANGRLLVGQAVTGRGGVEHTGCVMLNLGPIDTEALPGGLVAGYDLILITPAGRRIPFASQRFCVADAYTDVS